MHSTAAPAPPLSIGLIGNPNVGKTSLFNALTGYRRHVANYPGVTVDVGSGPVRGCSSPIELLDLPGTYSLAASSPDEAIVADVLNGRFPDSRRPQAVLAVVDATNLSRNLYLVSQVIETGLPIVVALNMMDVAEARGLAVNVGLLAERLGVPVVPVIATRPKSLESLRRELERVAGGNAAAPPIPPILPIALRDEVSKLCEAGAPAGTFAETVRLLLDQPESRGQLGLHSDLPAPVAAARARLAKAGIEGAAAEVRARYAWIARVTADVVSRPSRPVRTWSDRLDRVLMHKVGGAAVLILVLFFVFQAIYTWASPLMTWIDGCFAALSAWSVETLPDGWVRSFVADGLIAGVGGVVVFLPQILILFGLIAVLEDCGYLVRAAHMVDRIMRAFGLSGRAFIPLLSSFACAVPAILGTRAIADRRERLLTILLAPFMSCSARLPVYVLLISTFVPDRRLLGGWVTLPALVMLAMYLVGVFVAVPLGWLLKRVLFAGAATSFALELPSYKWPRWQAVVHRMMSAGAKFLVGAGTVILAVNLIVWAAGYFPHSESTRSAVAARAAQESWPADRFEHELGGAYLRESYLGRAGRWIEPAVKPLGWDWRIGVAVLASFPAREVVIGTLGTIYSLGSDTDESSASLRDAFRAATWPDSEKKIFTLPVALSIMVFFALCAQCTSTLAVMARETRSWRWPAASFVGMTTIAYLAAWATSAAASALGW